mmetsp:Transcript_1344/g.3100  ORF Transcript_1344/g.3100 Transcript_1344/m.3100 type:complete len:415 (+) Transcript_1344:298-1542(+)
MVQGMAFLSKKGFNPQNNTNRKQVWEAQQHSKQEKERLRKRQEQLQKEKEDQELELATRGEIGGSQAQLRFMYDAPPGMETKETKNGNQKSGTQKTSNTNDLSQIQPGDDAAAVAFRQMLAAAAASNGNQDEEAVNDDNNEDANNNNGNFKFTPSLQGSMVEADSRYNKKEGDDANEGDVKKAPSRDSRSALEKEVGRKNRSTQNNLSYEQQIERFPQLKNAPMAVKRGGADGDSDKPMMVHFKPLGSQILHVRCLACGIWGHQKGDRECQKSGWNPFAMPSNKSSSSILPPKRSEKESNHEEKDRRRERSEESDRRRHRRRRRHDNAEDSSVDSFRRRRKKRYKEHYASNDESNSDPSSEDSSKLKRRNDDRYDSSEDERRRRKRRKEKKRSRRHESSSHRKKKKKKRRHSSP